MLWAAIAALASGVLLVFFGRRASTLDHPFSHIMRAGKALDEGRYYDFNRSLLESHASVGREAGLGRKIGGVVLITAGGILLIIVLVRHIMA